MRSFMEGIVFGTVVGGLLGLLNTPRSGKENRAKAKAYLEDNTLAVEDLNESVQGLRKAIQSLTNEGLASVNAVSEEVTKSIESFTQQAQPRINRINDKLAILTDDMEKVAASMESQMPATTDAPSQ
ncbi:MAG: YtxH domain-containing protein [Trichococcus flocculiformis]|jgi:gas vesicle protein|uniref:YtxH domain-containing protein n=1 Tax=Trichococcus flocculiformis TaxID=82803 RepID=A0A847D4Q8_9LACT|nr:YtxH domain-containing protein [Trichococcus flocculiformis]MBP6164797.1 YtxH domain-containing protein [Trichococcus sp.]MBP6246532.1 YtxH domain-containing protein [Trichococcus sp.]MBP7128251.1 YtxH domain-containing protein [Trichococcus sp.]MBP8683325.1 YtxH domain-containing protein [Trichococcus sp.]MBP9593932.1 YtxH domain-containing protein [Trichococcus sp.]